METNPTPQTSGIAVQIKNSSFGVSGLEMEGVQGCRFHGYGHLFKGLGKGESIVRRQDFGIEDEALLAATDEKGTYADRADGGQKVFHILTKSLTSEHRYLYK